MMEWDSFDSGSEKEADKNEEEEAIPTASQRGRKNIRNVKELEDLNLDTRIADRNERERIKRIENREKKFREVLDGELHEDQLILDYDFVKNVPLVSVEKTLVQKMKTHQKEGVKFMWNACYESLEQISQSEGSGCIIAHCMGLGKTFQVISLVHTLLNHTQIGTRKVLICCPKNTLMNWINEFQKWITPDLGIINVFNPARYNQLSSRLSEIAYWQEKGGVCIINYELMRILLEVDKDINTDTLKFYEYLGNPGPDLVICDEGHVLKNEETKLSKAMSQIRTMRRIILTGTPLQNNLKEYHCMVQFIKPNLLGTSEEFANMFINPILNGQYENSGEQDVQLMKKMSHVLHKKLSGCIQRYDLSTLKMFLPEKREYVISIALTNSQIEMYRYYLRNYSAKGDPKWKNDSVALFADYQSLQRIWTHPYNLKLYADKHQQGSTPGKKKKKLKKKQKTLHNWESEEDLSDSETFHWSRIPLFWWVRFVESGATEDAREGNKLAILLKIIKECEEAHEKLLVFSGSLYSLHLIEYFLKKINDSDWEEPSLCNMTSNWEEELDYLILTGNTSSEQRDRYCKIFNEEDNSRLRLFLISTKGGGIGINLTAANRAVLFDVSWNPSHDIQSIFRIYRIGQKKPCFVYRLVASGTMEEKIYERQVAKQSISHRVVDEKQIARHYTQYELLKLYIFEPNKQNKQKGIETKDPLLRKILQEESERIVGIHEHDSLLEHREEEELQELEKNDAWSAFNQENDIKSLPEEERKMLATLTPDSFDPAYLRMVLETEYPNVSDEEISTMMAELIPRINLILERPDFLDIMKNQALLQHKDRCSQSAKPKAGKQTKLKFTRKALQSEENTITLSDTPVRVPERSVNYCFSDSDDSVFSYFLGSKPSTKKKKKRSKPLKVWGVRNGKPFGSPDRDS